MTARQLIAALEALPEEQKDLPIVVAQYDEFGEPNYYEAVEARPISHGTYWLPNIGYVEGRSVEVAHRK
jgi:hypothetical protein